MCSLFQKKGRDKGRVSNKCYRHVSILHTIKYTLVYVCVGGVHTLSHHEARGDDLFWDWFWGVFMQPKAVWVSVPLASDAGFLKT